MTDIATYNDAALRDYQPVKFQADSALLRELGERLVGQPHVALAELIKNAYDADATLCTISIDENRITVTDDGHGMTEKEFLDYWMTIGTRNKQDRATSRELRRNVTGSKGVGRLSAQFLAHRLEIVTAPKSNPTRPLRAIVDWDDAIAAGTLTEAEAHYKTERRQVSFAKDKPHGTSVMMTDLKQGWNSESIRNLGRQLWMFQSPIPHYGSLATPELDPDDFRITLSSTIGEVEEAFEQQIKVALQNYMAIITGELTRAGDRTHAHVKVAFRTGEQYSEGFDIDSVIDSAKWQIRVFKLSGRQPGGIDVRTARDYFAKFGGVMVYDAGFRLPYYGVEQDWLRIEFDHSHRKNKSSLLPERLHVRRALNDLPTQGRLLGVVRIDTGREARRADRSQMESGDYLKIQLTRDRLVSNRSYDMLCYAVRWSLDYYATRQRLREQLRAETARPSETAGDRLGRVRSLLLDASETYPEDDTIAALQDEFGGLSEAIDKERKAEDIARTLLGPLASAGMAALALEHESRKEMRRARHLLRALSQIGRDLKEPRIREIVPRFGAWLDRLEDTRRLFGPLLDPGDRDEVEALSAASVLEQVIENVRPLVPGVRFSASIARDIHLPAATFAEWNSLFQNVIVNASNATLDLDERRVRCIAGRTGRAVWIRVEDNGSGVEPDRSHELFEPFTRRVNISDERRALGLGGMGLGLTIVRMIANLRHARVSFVEPSPGWTTAFQISWSSSK